MICQEGGIGIVVGINLPPCFVYSLQPIGISAADRGNYGFCQLKIKGFVIGIFNLEVRVDCFHGVPDFQDQNGIGFYRPDMSVKLFKPVQRHQRIGLAFSGACFDQVPCGINAKTIYPFGQPESSNIVNLPGNCVVLEI